ncbi:MAG TPA: biopolymer transporter ExbD [Woeseiaceae bacterium]|nr:biopolymer transporter ExbD [Woeseiaceae bacterium]
MKLSVKPRPEPDVNLTSLIDVVLLLVVFFMVSTTFVKESELAIRLPEADNAARPQAVDNRIDVTITEQGIFLINGRELINNRPETIRKGLEDVSGGDTSLPLTISADANARHQDVVTAMDVAGRLGFVKINIAAINDPQDDSQQ